MRIFRSLAILALLLIPMLTLSVAHAQEAHTQCSTDSSIPTFAVITNGTQLPVKYYWIDENCKEQEYGTIESGKSVVQPTYATHPWIVRTVDTGVQVGDIIISQSEEPVVVEVACSFRSDVPVDMPVLNPSSVAVILYWVDESCNEVEYATIEAGQSVIQPTYRGHAWVLRDAQTSDVLERTRATVLVAPAL